MGSLCKSALSRGYVGGGMKGEWRECSFVFRSWPVKWFLWWSRFISRSDKWVLWAQTQHTIQKIARVKSCWLSLFQHSTQSTYYISNTKHETKACQRQRQRKVLHKRPMWLLWCKQSLMRNLQYGTNYEKQGGLSFVTCLCNVTG